MRGCLLIFAWLGLLLPGCSKLTNSYDHLIVACGPDVAEVGRVVRFVDGGGEVLGGDGLSAVFVDGERVDGVAVSQRGCAAVPQGRRGFLLARNTAGDRAAFVDLSLGDVPSFELPITLQEAPTPLHRETLVPACDPAAVARGRVPFHLQAAGSSRLNLFRLETRLASPGGFSLTAPLSLVGSTRDPFVDVPAEVPEGPYQLEVTVEDVFDRASGVAPKQVTCPVVIDRSAPDVSLVANAGSGGDGGDRGAALLQVAPGAALHLQARDLSQTDLYYCLQEQKEGGADVPCTTGYQLTPAGGQVYAPDQGLWTLSYYGVDAAGNQVAPAVRRLAVYHGDLILQLLDKLHIIDKGILAHQVVEAYPEVFEALSIYGRLPLEMEKRVVRDELVARLVKVGPHLGEWQRYDLRSAPIKTLAYGQGGRVLASLTEVGDLDLLGPDGTRQSGTSHVKQVRFVKGGELLLVRYVDGRVTLMDPVQGSETALRPSGVDEVTASADGKILLLRSGLHAEVVGLDGTSLAHRDLPLPATTDLSMTVAADGAAAAFVSQTDGIVLWSWAKDQVFGPLVLDKARCSVTAVAVSAGGAAVYIGTNDNTVNNPYIELGSAPVVCGLRRWTPATSAVPDVLSYPYMQAAKRTPNDVTQLELAADGSRLFALGESSNLLVTWAGGSLDGAYREVAAADKLGAVMAVRGDDLVAVAPATADEVRIFDQPPPAAGGATQVFRQRLSDLLVPVQALAIHPTSQVLATGDREGRVRFWRFEDDRGFRSLPTASGKPLPRLARTSGGKLRAAYVERGSTVVVDAGAGAVRLIHPEDAPIADLALLGEDQAVTVTAKALRLWSADGALMDEVATAGASALRVAGAGVVVLSPQKVAAWTVAAGHLVASGVVSGDVVDASLSPDGTLLALLRNVGGGRVLDLRTAATLAPLQLDVPYAVTGAGAWPFAPFSADGRQLVALNASVALILDANGQTVRTVAYAAASPSGAGLSSLTFVPGSSDLLAVSADNDAKDFVRLTPAGDAVARFGGYRGALDRQLAVLPGGLVAGRGQQDSGLRLWSLEGSLKLTLGDDSLTVTDFAQTADGRDFLTFDPTHKRLQFWSLGNVDEQRRGLCAALHDFVATRTDDWTTRARELCGRP